MAKKATKGSVKKAAAALDKLNDDLSKLSTKMVDIAGSYTRAKKAKATNDVKKHIEELKKMTAQKKKMEIQKKKLDAALEKAVSGLDADAELEEARSPKTKFDIKKIFGKAVSDIDLDDNGGSFIVQGDMNKIKSIVKKHNLNAEPVENWGMRIYEKSQPKENIDLVETVKVSLAKLLSESSKNTGCCK